MFTNEAIQVATLLDLTTIIELLLSWINQV